MNLRKIILGSFIIGVILIFNVSAKKNTSSLSVGDMMPNIKTKNLYFNQLLPEKNRFKLILFWASYDAESRVKNKEFSDFFSSRMSDKIVYKSVSLDEDVDVCYKTLDLDSISYKNVIFAGQDKDERLDIIDLYNFRDHIYSYLINDKGEICAINPTEKEIINFYKS